MDILYFFICVAVVFLCLIAGAVFLLWRGVKTKKTVLSVLGAILCAFAVLGLLGLGLLIWALSLNPYPYP